MQKQAVASTCPSPWESIAGTATVGAARLVQLLGNCHQLKLSSMRSFCNRNVRESILTVSSQISSTITTLHVAGASSAEAVIKG
jgi:hypothetical protein